MEVCGVPPRVLHPEPLPPERQKNLNCETFWKLMDRWAVPPDRALDLIGCDAKPGDEEPRPSFPLSDEQGKLLSCLLEIDLTLAVVEGERPRHHERRRPTTHATVPLDAIGRCDLSSGRHSTLVVEPSRTR